MKKPTSNEGTSKRLAGNARSDEADTGVAVASESIWRRRVAVVGGWLTRFKNWLLLVWAKVRARVTGSAAMPHRRWVFAGVAVLTALVAIVVWNGSGGSVEDEAVVARSTKANRHIRKARWLWSKKRRKASLSYYARAAKAAPSDFRRRDVNRLVRGLGYTGRSTKLAERALVRLSKRQVVRPLRKLFRSKESRYRRRRAGEVLQRMGRKVDLVPVWIETLESESCMARRLAVRRLRANGDRRAIRPLRALSEDGSIFSRPCGSDEARGALATLEQRLR